MATDGGEINALLGHGTEFRGKLTFEGTVRIDGKFEGEVFTDDVLIVGEGAEVRARIDVGTLIIRGGVVVGDISARESVEMHSPGRLIGNVVSPSLYIAKGVIFDGHCQMGNPDAARPVDDERPTPADARQPAADSRQPAAEQAMPQPVRLAAPSPYAAAAPGPAAVVPPVSSRSR